MEGLGIDLRELVLKASRRGVKLFLEFMRDGSFELKAFRNNQMAVQSIYPWMAIRSGTNQDELVNQIFEELMYHLDEAEKKIIETGGYDK